MEKAGLKKWIVPVLTLVILFCFLLIAALVIALNIVNKRLDYIALAVEETAEQHITADVLLNKSIPVNFSIRIADEVMVGIDMIVETVIPVDIEIPVNEKMMVPFKIGIKDYIKLDTTIMITDDVYADVEDTIYVNQNVTVPTSKRRGITLPIRASLPLNERVKISVDQPIPIHSVVPVDLLIIDTLDVGLNIKVPVKVNLPVRIPVRTKATVSFPEAISVVGDLPVSLTIPVDIPLSETKLAPCFIKIANGLRGLIDLNTSLTIDNNIQLNSIKEE